MKLFHLKKCNVTISSIMLDIDNLISSFVCKSFDGVASSKTAKRHAAIITTNSKGRLVLILGNFSGLIL